MSWGETRDCAHCASWLGPRTDSDGRTVGNCSRQLMRREARPTDPYIFGEGVGHTHEQGIGWARLATPPEFGCVLWEAKE
jgi:hypothetical protein